MKPFDEKYLLEAGRVAVAHKEVNERSLGAIGEQCFKAWTGRDRGVSIAGSNQTETVISSPSSGGEKAATGEIIGQSRAVQQIIKQIGIVAPTDATVLILGETGTGKDLIARELHRCSRRHNKPLVRVNCASIPNELYESEFFGHAKGAFTSAIKDRIGRFEAAAGGTLFLDEVGEIPLECQSKLLGVLKRNASNEWARVVHGMLMYGSWRPLIGIWR